MSCFPLDWETAQLGPKGQSRPLGQAEKGVRSPWLGWTVEVRAAVTLVETGLEFVSVCLVSKLFSCSCAWATPDPQHEEDSLQPGRLTCLSAL